jgi:hypothetical protein
MSKKTERKETNVTNNSRNAGKRHPGSTRKGQIPYVGSDIRKAAMQLKDKLSSIERTENPVELYYSDEVTGKLVANFPYSIAVGIKYPYVYSDVLKKGFNEDVSPTVMSFDVINSYGTSNNAADALNICARAVDAFVRHANSGSKNYESADLMSVLLGMDQVYALMHFVRKVIRLGATYAQNNRTIPDVIIASYGIDAEELRNHHADYVANYNILVDAMNRQFAIPKNLKVFLRRNLIMGEVYVDSVSNKAQLYDFFPAGVYKWNGTLGGGSSLLWDASDPIFDRDTVKPLSAWIKFINNLVIEYMRNQDISIICGDIFKAYGDGNCMQLAKMDFNETQTFSMDETVLAQIENATIMRNNTRWSLEIGDIIQSNNLLNVDYYYVSRAPEAPIGRAMREAMMQERLLNSHVENPDWKFNLEATRLSIGFEEVPDDTSKLRLICGTEIITKSRIYTQASYSSGTATFDLIEAGTEAIARSTIVGLLWESQFDWHPIKYTFIRENGNENAAYRMPIFGDIKQYAFISNGNLKGVHDYAMLSLFAASFTNIIK